MTTCTAGVVAATLPQSAVQAHDDDDFADGRKLLEWRVFTCKTPEKKAQLIHIFENALIPALNRQKITPVGIFETDGTLNEGDQSYDPTNDLRVFVLCQYDSPERLIRVTPKLLADKQYMKDAAAIFEAPMNDPIYDSCESTLMLGFNNCPKIEVPVTSKSRIFQIRFYNSYNIERNASKVDMFDIGGEIPLFVKCGMLPVFFGETVAGRMMPNLTYMVGFENMDEKAANWSKFGKSEEWKKLSSDPKYKDTANKILNIVLKPADGSQI